MMEPVVILLIIAAVLLLHYLVCTLICSAILKKQGQNHIYSLKWGLLGVVGILICLMSEDMNGMLFPLFFSVNQDNSWSCPECGVQNFVKTNMCKSCGYQRMVGTVLRFDR